MYRGKGVNSVVSTELITKNNNKRTISKSYAHGFLQNIQHYELPKKSQEHNQSFLSLGESKTRLNKLQLIPHSPLLAFRAQGTAGRCSLRTTHPWRKRREGLSLSLWSSWVADIRDARQPVIAKGSPQRTRLMSLPSSPQWLTITRVPKDLSIATGKGQGSPELPD